MDGFFQVNRRKKEMKWKHKELNKYPDILLSDCSLTNIALEGNQIIVNFSEYGFFKRDSQEDKYYRTDGSQIVIEGCDYDNISIKEIRTQQMSEELYFETMYEIEIKDFIENINTGKWRLEIVEEYYAMGSGFYISQIRTNNNCFRCYINIRFKNLTYLWSDIGYDCPY